MPTGNLPASGKSLFEKVYNASKKAGDSEEVAAKKAWAAVKNAGWHKDKEGKWVKEAQLTEFSLAIKRASFDPKTGERRWKADTSDIDDDSYDDSMSLDLFKSFISRIESKERPPEEFCSEFWAGGMPYVSVSHYPDLNGEAVPGMPEAVYIDGKFFKAKGLMFDNPVGRAAWEALKKDQEEKSENPVRVSIAFLDYKHQHKSNGYIFERKDMDEDFCPECFKELLKGEYAGRKFLDGHLIHLALTRVPVNKRTLMEVDRSMTTRKEDAESIIGEELAEEIEQQASLVGKSEALVIKAEDVKEDNVISEEPTNVPPDTNTFLANAIAEMSKSLAELKSSVMELMASKDKKKQQDDEEADDMDEDDMTEEEKKKKMAEKKSEVVEEQPVPSIDLVQAFSEAVAPVVQRLDILIAAQSNAKANIPQQIVPERRSINPAQIQQGIQQQAPGTPMSIKSFVERSVGLNK